MLQIITQTVLWAGFGLGIFLLIITLLMYYQNRNSDGDRRPRILEAIATTVAFISFTGLVIHRAVFSLNGDWMAQDPTMSLTNRSIFKIASGIILTVAMNELIVKHLSDPAFYAREVRMMEKMLIVIEGFLIVFRFLIKGAILGSLGGYIV